MSRRTSIWTGLAVAVLAATLAGVLITIGAPSSPARPPRQSPQNLLMKEHVLLLKGYIEEWARDHGNVYPPVGTVAESGDLPAPLWPTNPWTGVPLKPGDDCGDYEYAVAGDCLSFTLTGHLGGVTPYVVGGQLPGGSAASKDELTIQGVTAIGHGIEMWAYDNIGVYPPADEVAPGCLVGVLVDPWPRNPYTGEHMRVGTGRGDFRYTTSPSYDGYTLLANLATGATHDVGNSTQFLWERIFRVRISLKDMCVQGYVQVLKDYVDKWALAHDGALPTVEEMTPAGAVGQAQTWWPANPWTLMPMQPGTGDFEYAPGEASAFTLTVHQQPLPDYDGIPGSGYPPSYTAQ